MHLFGFDLGDLISGVLAVLVALGLMKRTPEGKVEVNHEAVKRLVPGFRGWGVKDEAEHLRIWARLNEEEQKNIIEYLKRLPSDDDRAIFILVLATIPDDEDQLRALQALANLDYPEFADAVTAFRLIRLHTGLLERVKARFGDWFDQAKTFSHDRIVVGLRTRWPGIQDSIREFGDSVQDHAEDLTERINQSAALHGAQQRRQSRRQRGFFGRLLRF